MCCAVALVAATYFSHFFIVLLRSAFTEVCLIHLESSHLCSAAERSYTVTEMFSACFLVFFPQKNSFLKKNFLSIQVFSCLLSCLFLI